MALAPGLPPRSARWRIPPSGVGASRREFRRDSNSAALGTGATKPRLRRAVTLALLALAALGAPARAEANLVTNGSFETPTVVADYQTYSSGAEIDGWTVGSGGVDHLGTFWQAAAGVQSLDLNGLSRGSVYQDVSTTSGTRYVLRFAMAGNADSVFGCPTGIVTTGISWAGARVAEPSFDSTGRTEKEMGWTYQTYELIATGTASRLEFLSLGPEGFCGPALDDVSLISTSRAGRTLAELPPPTVGATANVQPKSGTVLVGIPAGSARRARAGAVQEGITFVPLEEARQVPVGSFLDTTRGTVELVTATGAPTQTQAGEFSAGLFQILQSRARKARGLTELRLKGAGFDRCRTRGGRAGAAQLSRRTIRRLRASAKGRFRTRGRHSAATVRGTVWITADRCDGTLTTVKRGKVAVRDLRRKRTIFVKAGKSYLAPASR